MRRLAFTVAACAALAGCKVAATGVVVNVDGNVHPDQLRVAAAADGVALPPVLVPSSPRALTLPVSFFAELPEGTRSTTIDVTALAAGAILAHGASPSLPLAPHAEPTARVELTPFCGAGAMPASCSGAVFCDGFEGESGSTLDAWSAVAISNSGGGAANPGTSLTVAADGLVCAGSHALHATSDGANQQAFAYKTGLALPATTYLRAFVYLPSTASTTTSFDLFSFATSDVSHYLQLGYDPFHGRLFAFRNFGGGEIDFAKQLPTDRWLCLEVALGLDATAGSLAVSVDGLAVGTQTGVMTLPAGASYDTFDAGIVFATGSTELYLDEIVLAGAPIGCT